MTLSFFVHGSHELVGFGPGRFCWYWHLGACSCMYGKIRWQDQTKYWKTNWAYWKMNQSPTLYWEISLKLRGLPNLQLISTTATGLFTSCLSQQSCPVLVHKLRSITLCWLTSFSLLGSFEVPNFPGGLACWIFESSKSYSISKMACFSKNKLWLPFRGHHRWESGSPKKDQKKA